MSMTMREGKKKRLESKGWKIGDAEEFLGLSAEESAYIEVKLRLADGLRTQRTKRNLSQTEVAKLVRSSQSRVAKMEAGDPSVSIDLLVRTLLALGISGRELARFIESIEATPAKQT